MARVCTPVCVATTLDRGRPHGTTVSAFTSLSMSPPMVLMALDRGSDLLALIRRTGRLGLNILAGGQSDLALCFARKGADKFADAEWSAESGAARLAGAAAWVGCAVSDLIDGGDHVIVLGTVLRAEAADAAPLTYHARTFGTHCPNADCLNAACACSRGV
ncbi:NADH-FMN oxidoreductase RutF, flavin reductase (DIM6/NTAB) family [Sinosporangium album]|uniref:NADH-FMN oxidoreductase RutF, flavin reductase (DIM6/NTAB) family n=2 Tax=Sinosporangium album TaxID=504805 RepID=A0A1G7QJ20_9ACTN|nr:NADH-FMN oxidoreductase RutF, flavin reductase (DIM6/NTAB) family [Sinosporangium album]